MKLSGTLICAAILQATVVQAQETMQMRDSKGKNVTVPRPSNYQQCRSVNRKYLHYSEAENVAFCSSPERHGIRSNSDFGDVRFRILHSNQLFPRTQLPVDVGESRVEDITDWLPRAAVELN
jgi:hypothetical protein